MKQIFTIFSILLLNAANAQQSRTENTIINIDFITILKDSSYVVPLTVTEIVSGSKRIGVAYGDYDGASFWSVCSKKIIDNKITLRIFGINCKSFEKVFEVENDLKLNIELEYGDSKFKNRKDRDVFIRQELGIPFCGTSKLIAEELENANYQHCDGRIKLYNEIPSNEIYQWEKIEK